MIYFLYIVVILKKLMIHLQNVISKKKKLLYEELAYLELFLIIYTVTKKSLTFNSFVKKKSLFYEILQKITIIYNFMFLSRIFVYRPEDIHRIKMNSHAASLKLK